MSELLCRIESPADVRALPRAQLPELANDLRAFIIETILRVGGHLSSNLGAVELAVALHRAYQTPHDRIVWDVGHQAYAHKILTGRREQLETVRKWGGVSGFLSRDENPHDCFGAGHSSTAVSAAFGMAAAAKLQNENRRVAAVVGDGAMSGGMAFEALNNAGASPDTDLLVVLNDNEMSISPAVGALRNHLARVLSSPAANSARKGGRLALSLLPPALEMAEEARKRIKGALTPGGLFQALGFNYTGPVDGHDVLALAEVLGNLREAKGPQLLHVITVKGKGFAEAEKDPVKYHGVAPMKVEKNGAPPPTHPSPPSSPSYSQVFGEWLCAVAERDPRIVAVTPAMLEGSGMTEFARRFPNRCFDAGIAEQHAVTFAAGMACEGMRPVVAIYSTFLQRGYDQLIHDAALQNLPVVFAIDRAGLVGADGATHQGAFDLSYLRCLPNVTVLSPSDENETWRALNTALSLEGPVAVRYPRGKGTGAEIARDGEVLEVGKGAVRRRGTGLAVLAFGTTLAPVLAAAGKLEATAADMRFVKPLDSGLVLELARTHSRLATAEENAVAGGAGGAVLECLAAAGVRIPVLRLGIPDRYIGHGTPEEQRKDAGLDAEGIFRALKKFAAEGEK